MLKIDDVTRVAYNAGTTASAKAQAVLSALADPVTVKVLNGNGDVMGSGTMSTPWAVINDNVLTMTDVSSFNVTSNGTPDSSWRIRFESGTSWLEGSFGLLASSQEFLWSLPTWESGQTGKFGTATANTWKGTAEKDASDWFSVADGNQIVFGWKSTDPKEIGTYTQGVGGTYDLKQDANIPTGVTPSFTITSGPHLGINIDSSSNGVLTISPQAAASSYAVTANLSDGVTSAGTRTFGFTVQAQASGFVPQNGFSVSGTFADLGTITVTKTGGGFGATKPHFATMGFGLGKLYTDPLGSVTWGSEGTATYRCPFTNQLMHCPNARPIVEMPGYSTRRTVLNDTVSTSDRVNDGMGSSVTTWNCGEVLPSNWMFTSVLHKGQFTTFSSSQDISDSQNKWLAVGWKTYGPLTNADEGAVPEGGHRYLQYLALSLTDPTSPTYYLSDKYVRDTRICAGGSQPSVYNINAPGGGFNNKWQRQDYETYTGAVDQTNWFTKNTTILPVDKRGWFSSVVLNGATQAEWPNPPQPLYTSAQPANRFRSMGVYGYAQLFRNQSPKRWWTDLYMSINSRRRFELTDNATYANSTEAYILPPWSWSDTSVTLHVWMGIPGSYSGKHLHFVKDDGSTEYVGCVA